MKHYILNYYVIHNIGDSKRALYLWNTKDGVYFQAGCRFDNEQNFLEAVRKKYGTNSQYEKAMNFLKTL